jgi:hypothetical protein
MRGYSESRFGGFLSSSLLGVGLLGSLLGGFLGVSLLGVDFLGGLGGVDFLGCNFSYRRGKSLKDDR